MTLDHAAQAAADREQAEWQPIETAPKDGQWFYVKRDPAVGDKITESVYRWDASRLMWFAGSGWWHNWPMSFTHWKPLPSGDLYVRAFRQGAQHLHAQMLAIVQHADHDDANCVTAMENFLDDFTRGELLKTSPSPSAGSTAATDQG